jgi:hypothetical protein
MTAGLWGWDNRVLDGALRAGSEVAGLTVAALQSPVGTEAWQASAVTVAGGAWMEIDAGAPVDWRLFGLFRTNLTPGAVVRWMLGSAAGGGDVYDSGWLAGTVAAGYGQSVHDAGQTVSARYMRVEIADGGNPDGYVRVGLAYAGAAFVPARDQSADGASEGWESGRRVTESRGGQVYVTPGFARRTRTVAYSMMAEAEVYADIEPLLAAARLGRNALFVPYPGYEEARTALYGAVTAEAVTIPHGPRRFRGVSLTLTERL